MSQDLGQARVLAHVGQLSQRAAVFGLQMHGTPRGSPASPWTVERHHPESWAHGNPTSAALVIRLVPAAFPVSVQHPDSTFCVADAPVKVCLYPVGFFRMPLHCAQRFALAPTCTRPHSTQPPASLMRVISVGHTFGWGLWSSLNRIALHSISNDSMHHVIWHAATGSS
jgi:hypothetical protein